MINDSDVVPCPDVGGVVLINRTGGAIVINEANNLHTQRNVFETSRLSWLSWLRASARLDILDAVVDPMSNTWTKSNT